MDWKFTGILLLAGFAFFSGWQFALFVNPEDFRIAGYVLAFGGTILLLFSAATHKGGA
jgi:polyferredoxin